MLSLKQLQDVCLIHSNNQCRYLAMDNNDWQKWYCLKQQKSTKKKIDKKVSQFIQDAKKSGLDPFSSGVALGDNCSGYPVLKHIEQGYDK